MTLGTELRGVLLGVPPFDIGLLVLPIPWIGQNDIVFLDPNPVFHPTRYPTEAGFSIFAAEADVIPPEVFGDNSK